MTAAKKKPTQELVIAKAQEQLTVLAEEQTLVKLAELGKIEKALATGKAIAAYQQALEPLMPEFMNLAGKPLGFQLDKQYPPAEIRDCIIESLMLGLEPVGRHFAIIGGRTYVQVDGVRHLLRNFPGLTDLKTNLGVPEIRVAKGKQVYATVAFHADWKLDGKADELSAAIPCNAFAGGSLEDALLGKAERKGLMRVFRQITAGAISVGTVDDLEEEEPKVKDVTPEVEEKKDPTAAEILIHQFEEAADRAAVDKITESVAGMDVEFKSSEKRKITIARKAAIARITPSE